MLLWAKQPSSSHHQKRKLFCQEIHGLPFYRPSQFGIWTVFAFPSQTAFQYVRLLKGRLAATWFSRFARVRCFTVFVCNRNLWNFLYNCDGIDAELKHGFHGRLPCDHQTKLVTFARPLTLRRHRYEINRGQRKQITLSDWLGSQLLSRDTNFTGNGGRRFPAVINAAIDLDGRPNYSVY